ncbi:MAG: dihydropteroate synthase-like protein [Ignisphaera sp.]
MARILIVTGRLAEPIVREAVIRSSTKHVVDIIVAPVDVAAFLTPNYIASYLKSKGVTKDMYDLVMVPGTVKGSCKVIEEVLGVKAVKGTLNAYDVSELLKLEDMSILSEEKPADNILQGITLDINRRVLLDLEEKAKISSITVGRLPIPITPPPIRVTTEIAFAHKLSDDVILKKVSKLIDSGVDIVSVGFEALESHPDAVYRCVKLIKKEFDIPVAIDTSIPNEIIKGVEAGCDMVINLDLTNIEQIHRYIKNLAAVVIPRNPSTGSIPINPDERVELLGKTVEKLISLGIEKILADTVLDPPGRIFSSLLAYSKFKNLYPGIPMFMGVGNVAEFMDVDSVGVNALLIEIAQEIGVSVVLVSEYSTKTQGSTLEAKIAAQMMAIASARKSTPKDLGLSLLILKDKRRDEYIPSEDVSETVVASEEEKEWELDPMGIFKIYVNHDEGYIWALYIGRKGKILIKGRTAKTIRNEILKRELVSSLSHAMYLGIELAKAEEALRIGKNYIQELPLFNVPKPINIDKTRDLIAKNSP